MVLKIEHNNLIKIIKEYYKKKISLMVYGTFGVGKSETIRQSAKEIALSKGRKFVEWNLLSKEEKQNTFEYPEKYFCLLDVRLSSYDASDIKGLPDFKTDKETIDWKIPFFAKFLTLKGSDGILFFDEIGLATPLVMASCYQILYDKVVNDDKISDNWLVVGATNLNSDRAYTHEIAPPLKDRCGEVELKIPSVEDWTLNFAIPNKIDSRIIGFLNFKKSALHNVNWEDNQKFITPRSWARVSSLTKDIKKDWETISLLSKSAIGEGIAIEYVSFCKIQEKIKLEDLIKNPEKIEKIEDISIKFFLVSVISEKYNNKEVDFEKVMEISKVLDKVGNSEFVALLWRLCSSYTQKSGNFKKDFSNSKKYDKFIIQYGKFIV